ncbi:MAG: hypothetical protein R2794_06020 [Chitinophagales bacterium]
MKKQKISETYTITYGYESDGETKHTSLKKPIIFIHGLDPGYMNYKTTFDDCKYGIMGWIDIVSEQQYNSRKEEINDWTPEFDYSLDFFESLWNEGYDVIYFDYKYGDDYMQRNAFTLVHMLEWINEHKSEDSEETVIIGASMGGQITRYALAYMEKNNIPHCVRLTVNLDSGAKGSNLPLGLQLFGVFSYALTSDDSPDYAALEFQYNSLIRPASMQLLVPHVFGTEDDKSTSYRTDFLDELFSNDADGYSGKIRKVAVACGNKTATGQEGILPGDVLLDYEIHKGIEIDLGFGIVYPIHVTQTAWYIPGDDYKIYELEATLFGVEIIGTSIYVAEDFPARDAAPGSKVTRLNDQLTASFEPVFGTSDHFYVVDYFSFVNSISSLDVNTDDLYFDIKDEIFADFPNDNYPFAAYYSPESNNENHVQFSGPADGDEGNIIWMLDQMLKNENDIQNLPATIDGTIETTYNYGNFY